MPDSQNLYTVRWYEVYTVSAGVLNLLEKMNGVTNLSEITFQGEELGAPQLVFRGTTLKKVHTALPPIKKKLLAPLSEEVGTQLALPGIKRDLADIEMFFRVIRKSVDCKECFEIRESQPKMKFIVCGHGVEVLESAVNIRVKGYQKCLLTEYCFPSSSLG